MLRSRKNQILLAFSFWGEIKPRTDKHIYELRSYTLKVRDAQNTTGLKKIHFKNNFKLVRNFTLK